MIELKIMVMGGEMGWYLLNLRQAKISNDKLARLHKVEKEKDCFKLGSECDPGNQIRGTREGLFLFEASSDEEAFKKAERIVKMSVGKDYGVKKCDKCLGE